MQQQMGPSSEASMRTTAYVEEIKVSAHLGRGAGKAKCSGLQVFSQNIVNLRLRTMIL